MESTGLSTAPRKMEPESRLCLEQGLGQRGLGQGGGPPRPSMESKCTEKDWR